MNLIQKIERTCLSFPENAVAGYIVSLIACEGGDETLLGKARLHQVNNPITPVVSSPMQLALPFTKTTTKETKDVSQDDDVVVPEGTVLGSEVRSDGERAEPKGRPDVASEVRPSRERDAVRRPVGARKSRPRSDSRGPDSGSKSRRYTDKPKADGPLGVAQNGG